MKGSPAKNLPAVATCLERGWKESTVLVSDRWSNPRMIISFQGPFVTLRNFRRENSECVRKHEPDGTFTKMDGALGGKKPPQPARVRSFPPDVKLFENGGR